MTVRDMNHTEQAARADQNLAGAMAQPLLIVPATQLTVQAIPDFPPPGAVVVRLSNAVAACQMVLDADQAHALMDNIQRALLECRSVHVAGADELAALRARNGG